MITITFITNDGKQATAPDNSNLLRVSLREKGGIPFKCGGGLCGTCKCRIETGIENTDAVKPKERNHLTRTTSPPASAWPARPSCSATSASPGFPRHAEAHSPKAERPSKAR